VDAGAHLAKIIRILEHEHGLPWNSEVIPPKDYSKTLTNGPFAGIRCPSISAKANALHIFRELLHSFLITHPHLDHISGMCINTPALEYGREAKAIVALPSTIDAIKNHIFNDSIWPNLSDEGHGVGFVTYRRLIEGGNPRLGLGEGRGYVNVCDGLATKCWSVSHGRCRRRSHSVSHQRDGSFGFPADGYNFSSRRISQVSDGYMNATGAPHHHVPQSGFPKTPGAHTESNDPNTHFQPVDSSAFFIRNDSNGQEIIIFGDIEPDSVSLHPRNQVVWEDAAPKIASGTLKAIFIECSYDDSVRDEDLYGHLCPRHLIAELGVLAAKVMAHRRNQKGMNLQEPPSPGALKKKRKRNSDVPSAPLTPTTATAPNGTSPFPKPSSPRPTDIPAPAHSPARNVAHPRRTRTVHVAENSAHDPAKILGDDHLRPLTPGGSVARPDTPGRLHNPHPPVAPQSHLPAPLRGLTVHIIHVKDTLADGPPPGEVILKQLKEGGKEAGLGCEFDVTSDGESIWI
jgi:cAMP phosphodiesterase